MVHGDAVRETEKANRYDLNNCQPLTRYRGIAHAKKKWVNADYWHRIVF